MRIGIVRTAAVAAALVVVALGLAGGAPAVAGEVPESIASLLKAQVKDEPKNVCGRRDAALRGTLARLNEMSIPAEGRLILVNVASRTLAAYEDGNPVLESRVVIGKEGWRTPDLSTSVDYVRVNPTWTVPESIVKANGWRARLASNPSYFAKNGFDVVVRGRAIDPRDVADGDVRTATFVQRPARNNALGRIKIGLVNTGGIYLHDTNDKAAYDRSGVDSHGCIRVERVRDLAAWILGKDKADVAQWIEADDRANRKPEKPVKVVVGYFTAWPDGEGKVHYYTDIYNRDPRSPACRRGDGDAVESPYGEPAGGVWQPDEDDVQRDEDRWEYQDQ